MPGATIAELLSLVTRNPGRPRLTWYGDDGERIELSGAVLENWVNKTTNLLVEELDAAPGSTVLLDLPAHWRAVVWALAAWRAGATVSTVAADADVVVTSAPAAHAGADQVVAVALPALARRFDGPLPPGAVDAAAAVMTYGDALSWVPATDAARTAWSTATGAALHADLVPPPAGDGDRVLAEAAPDALSATLVALRTWAGDGSLVLVAPSVADRLRAAPDARERLVATERVTVDALG